MSRVHGFQRFACSNDLVFAAVSIAVQRRADVGMPGDGLQGFDVQMRRRHRDIGVPEGMRRCSVKANCPIKPLLYLCRGL